jgi:HlyD family secretion protein
VACGLAAVVTPIGIGVSRQGPALPAVERASLHVGTVERGALLRQVRGSGSLVPEEIRFVQAEFDGRVERILVPAGAAVAPDTVVLELSNPELEQAAFDAEWQLVGAEAQLDRLRAQLASDRLAQRSALAALDTDCSQAELDARASERLAEERLVSTVELERSRARAAGLRERRELERQRLEATERSSAAQLAAQQAEVERARALLARKRQQVAALRVRAGVAGVLQQTGDETPLEIGQRVAPSATLAKIVEPTRLKAVLKVAETQAQELQLGQAAEIDTRSGIVPGRLVRIDTAARNGTVTVEVQLAGPLPKGVRPDSSVDGVIELERLDSVLYVGRPVHAQSGATVGLFRLTSQGDVAERVDVQLGRSSVSLIEVVAGLDTGDQVILSDMTSWVDHERIRLR